MHLVPLTRDLIPACATAGANAFAEDNLFLFLRPHKFRYPTYLRSHFVRVLHQRLNTPALVGRVAVSDDNDEWFDESVGSEVLGYATWERRGKDFDQKFWGEDSVGKLFERFTTTLEVKRSSFFRLDPSYDYENLQAYLEAANAGDSIFETCLEDYPEHMWLAFLCVDPKFQRKGVGKRLMQWGMKRADQESVPLGLASSPAGEKLYRDCGFEEVGVFWLEYKGTVIDDKCMIRWGDIRAPKKVLTVEKTLKLHESNGVVLQAEPKEKA